MKLKSILHSGLLLSACLATGCISHQETVHRDEPRVRVEFENDAAARYFYETLHAESPSRPRRETNTQVSIPIVFEHKHHVVSGENTAFNDAVRRCDTNGDGKITEQEARIFAAHH